MGDKLKAVIKAAREVAEIVLPYFSRVIPDIKHDGTWITEADHSAHEYLSEQLALIHDVPVLSEELLVQAQQEIIASPGKSYWCIDPIDGTSNFTLGIPYWCISIALIINGEVELAVVYDPNQDEIFATEDDAPSTINNIEISRGIIDSLSNATALIDLKRIPRTMVADLCAIPPYRSQRSLGASALELCWVAADRCQLYLHGGQHLWDHVAAIQILQNAGGRASCLDGNPLRVDDLTPQSIVAGSSQKLFSEWQDYLRRFS